VTATVDGRPAASESLTVRGDERLASALAARSGNAGGGTGIGRAIATVFGNVQVLLAVVLVFAAAMSIAGTGAAFAYDVDANARNVGLYRTLGATRAQVLSVLVGDAARIGTVATALALVVGSLAVLALGELGVLRLFGVSVAPRLTPRLLVLTGVSCLALTVLGTVLASIPTLRAPPRALLDRGEEP
jgi:predicted lysophospholipase L1 biosynthesis ABC-type transport system permease subunit